MSVQIPISTVGFLFLLLASSREAGGVRNVSFREHVALLRKCSSAMAACQPEETGSPRQHQLRSAENQRTRAIEFTATKPKKAVIHARASGTNPRSRVIVFQ